LSEAVARTMPDTDDAGGNGVPLRFTGNWFIDIGILGFVNLMEEVYGWSLDDLKKKLKENPDRVYYGYFPFAYLFYHSRVRSTLKKVGDIKKTVNDLSDKAKENKKKLVELLSKRNSNSKDSEVKKLDRKIERINSKIREIEEKIWKLNKEAGRLIDVLENEKLDLRNSLESVLDDILNDASSKFTNKKEIIDHIIPNFDLNQPPDHRNFFIYNPKKDLFNSFVYLFYLLREDFDTLYTYAAEISSKKKREGLTYETHPDSTVNPFLPSVEKFSNIDYTLPISLIKIKSGLNLSIPLYVVLLSFSNAFNFIDGRYISFYTNNLDVTYKINKRIKTRSQRPKREGRLLHAIWVSAIDELVESKARFSIENMYIIEIASIDKQKLRGVEFIGIPKFQATFLLDDTIRNSINTKLEIDKKREVQKYLIEEFVKGQPLTPIVIKNIRLSLSEKERKIKIPIRTAITASALDLAYTSSNDLFSDDPLDRNFLYRNVEYVKRIISEAHSLRIAVSDTVQTNERLKEGLALRLLDLALKENKYEAINTALRVIVAHTKECDMAKLKHIINPLLKAINDNAPTWRVFIIAFSLGLLGGNQNAGG